MATYDPEGNLLSEINGELKSDFYSGIESKMTFRSSDSRKGVVSISDGKVLVEPLYDLILLTPKAIWGYIPKQ